LSNALMLIKQLRRGKEQHKTRELPQKTVDTPPGVMVVSC